MFLPYIGYGFITKKDLRWEVAAGVREKKAHKCKRSEIGLGHVSLAEGVREKKVGCRQEKERMDYRQSFPSAVLRAVQVFPATVQSVLALQICAQTPPLEMGTHLNPAPQEEEALGSHFFRQKYLLVRREPAQVNWEAQGLVPVLAPQAAYSFAPSSHLFVLVEQPKSLTQS